jgi:hypothetical protein
MEPEGSLPILSQIDPVHTAPSYLPKIQDLYLRPLGLPSGLFPSGFPTNVLHAWLFSPFVLHAMPISSSLTLSFYLAKSTSYEAPHYLLPLCISSSLLPSGFPTKILYVFPVLPMRTTCPANMILSSLIAVVSFSEEYKLWNSSLLRLIAATCVLPRRSSSYA